MNKLINVCGKSANITLNLDSSFLIDEKKKTTKFDEIF